MERKDRNWLAGVAGVSVGLMLLMIILLSLLPSPSSGPVPVPKPTATPSPKPTPTPKPTYTALPTATAAPHDGNGGGTVQPTATAEGQNGTPIQEATPTPSPTSTAVGQDSVTVYFNRSSYTVDESEAFWTSVMISAVDYFWGAQFDIEYDYTLIEARPGAARRGSLYDANTGNWTEADAISVSRVGSGPNEEGLIRVLVDWRNHPPAHGSTGLDTTGGTLAHLKWRTTTSAGTTGLNFAGTEYISKLLVGYGPPPTVEWAIKPVIWANSSVTVR